MSQFFSKVPTRCVLWVWYRGDRFNGYQAQRGGGTVEQTLMTALGPCSAQAAPKAAGRTDKGVHARMQVVSVPLLPGVSPDDVEHHLRDALPSDAIGVVEAIAASRKFHAAWSNTGKEYRYRFALGPSVPSAWREFAWHIRAHHRFDGSEPAIERLDALLRRAEGTRDFIAFHEKSSGRRLRRLESARIHELGGGVFEARLRGDAFGRYQVRFLVGNAALAACGKVSEEQFVDALERGVELPGVRAPAEGLTLWEVFFPPQLDPFGAELRALAPGVPDAPPFTSTPTG